MKLRNTRKDLTHNRNREPEWLRWFKEHHGKQVGLWRIGDLSTRFDYSARYVQVECIGCGLTKDVQITSIRLGNSSGCKSCRGKDGHPKQTDEAKRERLEQQIARINQAMQVVETIARRQPRKRNQ